jgi:uncharacterized membrane protein YdbT with pleckstrin-like domain
MEEEVEEKKEEKEEKEEEKGEEEEDEEEKEEEEEEKKTVKLSMPSKSLDYSILLHASYITTGLTVMVQMSTGSFLKSVQI